MSDDTELYFSLEPQQGKGPTRCIDFETPRALERAKELAELLFHDMIYLQTIAVMRKGKIIDVYDGRRWSSDYFDIDWSDPEETKYDPDENDELRGIDAKD